MLPSIVGGKSDGPTRDRSAAPDDAQIARVEVGARDSTTTTDSMPGVAKPEAASGHRLRLRCMDGEGVALPRLGITILERESVFAGVSHDIDVELDSAGTVDLVCEARTQEVAVVIRDADWCSDGRWYIVGGVDLVTVRCFRCEHTVHGQVRDIDGRPLPGARVTCGGRSVVSDDGGSYRIAIGGPSARHLTATRSGFTPAEASLGTIEGPDVLLDWSLSPCASVTGKVVVEGGAALAGARVTGGRDYGAEITSGDGVFHVDYDPDQPALVVWHPAFPLLQVDLRPFLADLRDVQLMMQAGVDARIRVLDTAGAPIPCATIRLHAGLSTRQATTDPYGEAILGALSAGPARGLVTASGHVATEFSAVLARNAGATVVTIENGGVLRGRVQQVGGQPIADATVWLLRGGSAGTAMAGDYLTTGFVTTDRDGSFAMKDMPQVVALEVHANGFRSGLFDGLIRDQGLHVIELAPTGVLCGRVLDGVTGAPVTTFTVRLFDADLQGRERGVTGVPSEWFESGCLFQARDGMWTLTKGDLTPGSVTGLEITAPGYSTATFPRVIVSDVRSEKQAFRLRPLGGR